MEFTETDERATKELARKINELLQGHSDQNKIYTLALLVSAVTRAAHDDPKRGREALEAFHETADVMMETWYEIPPDDYSKHFQ